MLWEVIDQSTGQIVNGGTFTNGSFNGLTLKPASHDDSTYTVEVGFAAPGQTRLQPDQVTQSMTLYVVTTEQNFEVGSIAGEDSGSVAIQKFYDSNPNAMSEEFAGSITIDWGDGSQGSGTIQNIGDGTYEVKGDHTYENGADFTTSITVTTLSSSSSSSGSSSPSSRGHVRVMNPAANPGPVQTPTMIYVINDLTATAEGHSAIIIPNGNGCTYYTYDNSNQVTTVSYNNISGRTRRCCRMRIHAGGALEYYS